jgi:hypothetical protein
MRRHNHVAAERCTTRGMMQHRRCKEDGRCMCIDDAGLCLVSMQGCTSRADARMAAQSIKHDAHRWGSVFQEETRRTRKERHEQTEKESGEEWHWCSQQVGGRGERGGAQGGGTILLKAVFEGREYEGERCGARLGRVMREKCEVMLEVDERTSNGTQGERYGSDG